MDVVSSFAVVLQEFAVVMTAHIEPGSPAL
jgi:hypothetical protein